MTEQPQKSFTDDGSEVVCACFEVTKNQLSEYLSKPGNTVEGIAVDLGVGTKCTACLLDVDLYLDEHFKKHIDPSIVFKATENVQQDVPAGKFRGYLNERESGFFVQNGTIKTILSFVNYSELFEGSDTIATFDYRLRLYNYNGDLVVDTNGVIGPEKAVRIDFSDFPDCPEEGWFLLSVIAQNEGLCGSIRPQFMLVGENFSATVHTQQHMWACRRKSVMILPDESGYRSSVALLNPSKGGAAVTLALCDMQGNEVATHEMTLSGLGGGRIYLDDVFPATASGEVCIVHVASDIPIRKHIINHLSDGSWSIDHFPNSK